ncbi:MAG: barstar family protein [Eubacterium sp.]|nr:barstar family protein [Eubacterium sp.]
MKLTIDLSGITSRAVLHKIFQLHLDLPPYYGRNLDALHDCLAERQGETEIVLTNEDLLPEHMRPYIASLRKMLGDLAKAGKRVKIAE